MAPQWFIRLLDKKEDFLARSKELKWHPEHMKVRLDQWIEGLKYDWNISRQRFYGVPFPLWYVKETGDIILADEKSLPVDPLEDAPPEWAQEKYKGLTIVGEPDVMDTWMTSSLSPLLNANWANSPGRVTSKDVYPMSMHVQAFEIIRTWLFYSLVKSHHHTNSLPWENVMISGWGLNEQGKKISKRDLEQYTDANGFNRYDPHSIVQRYGADAVRYWAAGSRLGNDLRFHEKDVKVGRKLVTKLWNVARMCTLYLKGYSPSAHTVALADRSVEDKWLVSKLNRSAAEVTAGFEKYDYAIGREALDKFFWGTYCDNYLEIVKDRLWRPEAHTLREKHSAQTTLYESMRSLLGLYAPYIPYVTEELYQRIYASSENVSSIHITQWPKGDPQKVNPEAEKEMDVVISVLDAVRCLRTQNKISMEHRHLMVEIDPNASDTLDQIDRNKKTVLAATRCEQLFRGTASYQTKTPGLKIGLVP
jgi:valyl-tRNA synthetase